MTNLKRFVSATTIPEVTKVSSVVTQDEGPPIIKSNDHLNGFVRYREKLKT